MKILVILLFTLMQTCTATAQQQNDSILPKLTTIYFEANNSLDRNYNYELLNKKKQLRRTARDIDIVGGGIILGMSFFGSSILQNLGWSEWPSILCTSAVALSAMGGLIAWSNHLRKKADAIQVETAYVLPVGRNTDLGAAVFTNRTELGIHAVGIGLKTSF